MGASFYSPATNAAINLSNKAAQSSLDQPFSQNRNAFTSQSHYEGPICKIGGKLYAPVIPTPGIQAITPLDTEPTQWGQNTFNVILHYSDGRGDTRFSGFPMKEIAPTLAKAA